MRRLCLIAAAVVSIVSPAGAASTVYNVTLCPEVARAPDSRRSPVGYGDVLDSLSVTTSRSAASGLAAVGLRQCRVRAVGGGVVGVAIAPDTPVLELTLTGSYAPRFSTGARGARALAEVARFADITAERGYLRIDSTTLRWGEIRNLLAAPAPALR